MGRFEIAIMNAEIEELEEKLKKSQEIMTVGSERWEERHRMAKHLNHLKRTMGKVGHTVGHCVEYEPCYGLKNHFK